MSSNYTAPDNDAFPSGDPEDGESGINTRAYFSAKMLQGILANPSISISEFAPEKAAEYAVSFADALMRELNGESRR